MKVRLTESELVSLIKKIIKEEKTTMDDIKYMHPVTGKECLIKVAKHKYTSRFGAEYGSILVCDEYDDGEYIVVAELPVNGGSFEEVSDFICARLDRTFEILDDMLSHKETEEELTENYSKYSKWDVIDQPIVCSDKEKKKSSWEA
jgi:hypothetical protein